MAISIQGVEAQSICITDNEKNELRESAPGCRHRPVGGIRSQWPLCLYAGFGDGGDQRLDLARLAVQLQARP